MDEKDLDKKLEEMMKSSDILKQEIEMLTKVYSTMGLTGTELKKKLVQVAGATDDFRKVFKKSSDQLAADIIHLRTEFNKGAKTAQDLDEELSLLRRQINNTADQNKKAALIEAKAELEAANARAKATDIFKTSIGELSGTVVSGVTKSFTGAAKAVMSGSDGFAVAATVMSAQVDMVNGATQVGAKGLSAFGAATAGAGGKLGKFGIAASVAGAAISALGNGVSDLVKTGIQFMLQQTQKTITSFQAMNASGATFAGGMTEMRNTASTAGLTLEQLSKVSTSLAGRMSDGGMTVTEATKQIAATGKAMKDSGIQKNLLNLGYSFEQQAEMSAKVASDMNRGITNPAQRASAQEVAAQTEKYAQNLKLVSNLTGENAAALAEKVRGENTELAFEAEKAKMSATQRAELDTAMAAMTEQERKNLRERMVFGTVINKQGAIMEATVDGAREKGERAETLLRNNELTAQRVSENNAMFAERQKASVLENSKTIGAAAMANGELSEQAKAQADLLKQSNQQTQQNVDQAKKDLADQTKGKGSAEIVNAQQKSQELLIATEKIATDNLSQFAKAVDTTIDSYGKAIEALTKFSASAASSTDTMAKVVEYGTAALGAISAIGSIKGMFGGGAAGGAGGAGAAGAGGALKGTGKLLGKAGGPIGALLGIGMSASDYFDISKKEKAGVISAEEASKAKGGVVGEAGGGIAGGLAGAAAGAAIGSVVPVIGTAIGGVIGGIVGGFGGGKLGKWGGESLMGGSKSGVMGTESRAVSSNAMPNLSLMNEADRMSALQSGVAMASAGGMDSKLFEEQARNQKDMLDIMKKQNEMFERQLASSESSKKILEDHKDLTQRLMYNMT